MHSATKPQIAREHSSGFASSKNTLCGIPSKATSDASPPSARAIFEDVVRRPARRREKLAAVPFVSGFSGGRVKQHPIANPNRPVAKRSGSVLPLSLSSSSAKSLHKRSYG